MDHIDDKQTEDPYNLRDQSGREIEETMATTYPRSSG